MAGKAFTMISADSDIPWKGDGAPPEKERCFAVPVRDANSGKKIKRYFCVLKDDEGDVDKEKASLLAMDWVVRINRYFVHTSIKQSQSVLEKLTEKISEDSSELNSLKEEIH